MAGEAGMGHFDLAALLISFKGGCDMGLLELD